ncbi:hypothetical protein MYX77_08150 [Acidobacteriia bacterium AH_259_A11_L15]|nr:hypothetical protein [Acidobacteriia bacterium AH_259_A11_L15]
MNGNDPTREALRAGGMSHKRRVILRGEGKKGRPALGGKSMTKMKLVRLVTVSGVVLVILGFFLLNYMFASLVLPVLHPSIVRFIALAMTAWGLVNFFSKRK